MDQWIVNANTFDIPIPDKTFTVSALTQPIITVFLIKSGASGIS